MLKSLVFLLALSLPSVVSLAQEKTFTEDELFEDYLLFRKRLLNAHTNPFSKLTEIQFNHELDMVGNSLDNDKTAENLKRRLSAMMLELLDGHAKIINPKVKDRHQPIDYADSIEGNITYRRYGKVGYLYVRSFATRAGRDDLALYEHNIDSIFRIIQKDGVGRLVIDVSQNDGGHSGVGNMLIDRFYDKPYKSYAMNWRRSDEYLELMRSWGIRNEEYEKLCPGDVIHSPSRMITPSQPPYRFKGKVFLVVGVPTFSSATMFATLVKDNKMAPLAGQVPFGDRPTHFGEMYYFTLPNTGLIVRFGVKEWVRPAGRGPVNELQLDFPCQVTYDIDRAEIAAKLPW